MGLTSLSIPTSGVTYYYLLEEVEVDGDVNRVDPIEVTAEARGPLELILASALFLVALVGFGVQFTGRVKTA